MAVDSRHKVDGIPPVLALTDGAVVNGTTLTLAYSEPLRTSPRPSTSAFTVAAGNELWTVTQVRMSGSAVLLTLTPAVQETDTGLQVSYQPGSNPIRDVVGNDADGLNDQPVTNNTGDTAGPTVQTVRITSNAGSDQTYAIGDLIEVTVTFNETVVVTGTPRLTLNVGSRTRTANYRSVAGGAVAFEYKVVSPDMAADGVGIEANRLSRGSGTIRDGAQNNAVLEHAAVAADSQHKVDGVRPKLATSNGAVANGTMLTLAYGEPLDSFSVPSTDAFTVTGGSETRTVAGVRVDGSAVFLTLSPAVQDGETGLRVNYTVPTETGENPIQGPGGATTRIASTTRVSPTARETRRGRRCRR